MDADRSRSPAGDADAVGGPHGTAGREFLPALELVLAEIEQHAAASGWDRPPQLFALVETEHLLASQPHLATQLQQDPTGYTPVEQDALPEGPLDDALAGLMWPAGVVGCALVHEVLVLPPAAEAARPADADPERYAREHGDRREVRLAVAVLADGSSVSAVRLRSPDAEPDELMFGTDLAPNLTDALLATLR